MILQEIGDQLDKNDTNNYPRVYNRGIVTPNNSSVSLLSLGQEVKNEQPRKRRSTAKSRTRPTTGERSSSRPRASSNTAPLICPEIQAKYENELDDVYNAYPGTRVWQQAEGLWLLSESALLPGLWQKAVFLTGIPFVSTLSVRSWGFWVGGLYKSPTWIGPRHTNYPDGSVCAFEPKDGTWNTGKPLVQLLDLYTLWALRHLYLQKFGRWPGRQTAHYAHERIMEFNKNEYCGCDNSDELYENCCQQKDLAGDWISSANEFKLRMGSNRNPPEDVMRFICDQTEPLKIGNLLAF